MKKISTVIYIDASPKKVWDIFTDFVNYPSWNPFILNLKGEVKRGKTINVSIQPPSSMKMSFSPKILIYSENELRWVGKFLLKGLFDGEHCFTLEDLGGRTRFIQEETFKGLLVPLFSKTLKKTKTGFELMNIALKERAESH